MEARIVREELQKCHKAEGVNHYQACADLAKKYHSLLADAKVSALTSPHPPPLAWRLKILTILTSRLMLSTGQGLQSDRHCIKSAVDALLV